MSEGHKKFKRTSSVDDELIVNFADQSQQKVQPLNSILINSNQQQLQHKTPLLKRMNSQSNSSNSTINSGRELNYCEVYYLSPSKRQSRENIPMTPNQSLQRQYNPAKLQQQFSKKNSDPKDIYWTGGGGNRRRSEKPTESVFNSNCSRNVTSIISGNNTTTEPIALDNFDVCSHYSDSVGTIHKTNLRKNSFSGIGSNGHLLDISNNFTGSSNAATSRTQNVTFLTNYCNDEHIQNLNAIASGQQQIINSNRGSLKRNKGRSNQSLCSCDAGEDTEFEKNPNRPLYQYSLDRKKKSHTYTCEQNAQILMRLEREKLLRKNSFGGSSNNNNNNSNRKLVDKQGNELSFTANGTCDETSFDYPDLNNSIESDSTSTDIGDTIPPPPPPPLISTLNRNQQQLSMNNDILISNDILHKQKKYLNAMQSINLPTSTIPASIGTTTTTTQPVITTIKSNIGSIGESMLNDCTQTILNCANAGQMIFNNATASVIGNSGRNNNNNNNTNNDMIKPDICQTSNNNIKFQSHHNFYPIGNEQSATKHDINYPYSIRDDSYIPYCKNKDEFTSGDGKENSVYFYHQELPYAQNFDNRTNLTNCNTLHNNFTTTKYNTIGPSNCINSKTNQFHQNQTTNGYCNHGLLNSSGRYFSQSLTNFTDWHQQQQLHQQHSHHNHLPYSRAPLIKNDLSCSFAGTTTSGLCTDDSTNFNSTSFTTLGSCSASGLKIIGSDSKDLHQQQKHYHHHNHSHLHRHHLRQQQNGLTRSLSNFMPWKYRQCSNSTNSGSSTTIKFDLAKHWLAISSILLLIGAASVAVPLALRVAASAPFEERLQIATQLLDTVPLIDGHNDLPWNIRKFLHNKLNDFNFDEDLRNVMPWAKSHWSHTDLQRLKTGRVSAQFWAAYVPCEAQHRDAVQLTLEQIDVIKRLTERYSPQLTTCTSASDIIEAHRGHKLCSLTGVEGGHSLGGSLAVLRTLYNIGVRYMTLTSTCHTPWADSSSADAPTFNIKHGGLTPFGKTIIREMNRLGMIVDLSHVSTGTMRDALATSEAPVIFSHSSAYELCNSSRNVQDDILISLAKNGGLVMVNFYSKFLSCNENSTVHDAVAHINHIKKIAGIDHVGLGAGFDGINFTPKGLEDVSTYPTLFAELLGEGWSIDELKKLAGENFLRVMSSVEKLRDEKKKTGIKPFEDHPNFRTEDPYNCTSS